MDSIIAFLKEKRIALRIMDINCGYAPGMIQHNFCQCPAGYTTISSVFIRYRFSNNHTLGRVKSLKCKIK